LEQTALNFGPERHYFSVSELSQLVRSTFAMHFGDVWIAGEISGTKIPPSGHIYFTLKDDEAQLRCVCYRMDARYLKFKPKDGVAVLARGRLDFYEARGDTQFIVSMLEPQGYGALQLAFEQLKKKLAEEGLFDAARKRPIPPMPERIGIVTSPAGAVIRDILQILDRRFPGRRVRIYPALVQGEGSIEQVTAGIEYFSRKPWAQVVIVARGGGSLEDLLTFNTESVARAIAASSIPVISAIGHETDFTIADFVADLRAPTPSAAAELVICTRQSITDRIQAAEFKLRQAMRLNFAMLHRRLHAIEVDRSTLHRAIGKQMQRVDEIDYRLRDRWRAILDTRRRALDSLSARLAQLDVRLQFARTRRRLDACDSALTQSIRQHLNRAHRKFGPLAAHLEQLSPVKILDRGYAIVERDGHVIKSPAEAPEGSDINVRLAEGRLKARILTPDS